MRYNLKKGFKLIVKGWEPISIVSIITIHLRYVCIVHFLG